VLSVIPFGRSDFCLRRETVHLLEHDAGLSSTDLEGMVFVEDVDLDALAERGQLDLVLTDHNVMSSRFQHLSKVCCVPCCM